MVTPSDNSTLLDRETRPERGCVGRGITSPVNEQVADTGPVDSMGGRIRKRLFDRFVMLRSTAFRIAILFWLLFTACFGAGSYFVYQTLQGRVLQRLEESIVLRFDEMQSIYNKEGIEAIIRIGESRNQSPMDSSIGFHLSSPEGERIAGNVPVCPTLMGWDVLQGKDLGLEGDESYYRFYAGDIGGNILSLGRSLDDLVDLRKIALSSLMWTTLVATLLAFLAAGYFARRTHIRVAGVSRALDGVGQGNLNARLPVGCAGDDIDRLSTKINTSLERLEHTVNGMRQVSTDIAHDLKTPLNRLYITIDEAAAKVVRGYVWEMIWTELWMRHRPSTVPSKRCCVLHKSKRGLADHSSNTLICQPCWKQLPKCTGRWWTNRASN